MYVSGLCSSSSGVRDLSSFEVWELVICGVVLQLIEEASVEVLEV